MNSDELKKRTIDFAHSVVKMAVTLPKTALGEHVGRQLVRCSTSVAANYRAALLSQTKASFVAKVSIVIEEADEAEYWLEFLADEGLRSKEDVAPLLTEAHELASIFVASRRTAQTATL